VRKSHLKDVIWVTMRLVKSFPICSFGMQPMGELLSSMLHSRSERARKPVRGLCEELTEEEQYRVAVDVVHRLEQHGDSWLLSEE
jgi:hypothetical protein